MTSRFVASPCAKSPVMEPNEIRHQTEWEEVVKLSTKSFAGFAAAALLAGGTLAASTSAQAETINIRIACSEKPVTCLFIFRLQRFVKYEIRSGMSDFRSTKGERCIGITYIR